MSIVEWFGTADVEKCFVGIGCYKLVVVIFDALTTLSVLCYPLRLKVIVTL